MTALAQRPFLRQLPLWHRVMALILLLAPCRSGAAETVEWQELKSRHFIVQYSSDAAFAAKVAAKAEDYYQTITTDVGFTRHKDFWLWDHRARITLYPDPDAFRKASGAPPWASGRSSARLHEIAGARSDEQHFLSIVLPHEITHLILSEFIGSDRVPQWLSEGVAQWQQDGRQTAFRPRPGMPILPLKVLMNMDIRHEQNFRHAALYYAECASLVACLIRDHGSERFARLCRYLRDGRTPEEALAATYPGIADTPDQLEQYWLGRLRAK